MSKGAPKRFNIVFSSLKLGKIEPKTIYLSGGTNKDFEYIEYTPSGRGQINGLSENFVYLTNGEGIPIKLKNIGRYKLEITKSNNMERTMSGNINLKGKTTDGTPIDITGFFNEISY